MDPMFVARPASSIATPLLKRLWLRLTADRRASAWLIQRLQSQGFSFDKTAIKRAFAKGKLKKLLDDGSPAAISSASRSIGGVRVTSTAGEFLEDSKLLTLLRTAYIATGDPGPALASHHLEVIGRLDHLDERTDRSITTSATFPFLVRGFAPPIQAEARRLRDIHPIQMERLVSELASTEDRRATLTQWSKQRPTWLSETADIVGWIGEIALDSDAGDAAAIFLDSAITLGAAPSAYWRSRRLALLHFDSASQERYLADDASHPLVVGLTLGKSTKERIESLHSWSPTSAVQRAYKASLIGHAYRDASDFDSAIDWGVQEFRDHGHYGAALVAMECLLRRGVGGEVFRRGADLNQALAFGREVRDARRTVRATSGAAVAHSMRAYTLLLDDDKAWRLSQAPPDGEATVSEAAHPAVQAAAIVLMAERGDIEAAEGQLSLFDDVSVRLQVEARVAELAFDDSLARELWSKAVAATDDWDEKASLCYRQALHGFVDPFVTELRPNNPSIADEIELVASVFRDDEGALTRADAEAESNPRIAGALMQYYGNRGRLAEMTAVAERAARRWGSADDMLHAAQGHFKLGQHLEALKAATNARLASGGFWGGLGDALRIQVECAAIAEDWPSAAQYACELMQLEPDSTSARWALIRIHVYAGEEDIAFAVWSASDRPLLPHVASHAVLWLHLFQLNGSRMASLRELHEIAVRFKDDAEVRGKSLAALAIAPVDDDDEYPLTIPALQQQLTAELPDQADFREVKFSSLDPETILLEMDKFAGPSPDLSSIFSAVEEGTIPIGLASKAAGRSLMETLVSLSQNPRYLQKLNDVDEEHFVALNMRKSVYVDVTAFVTLALLPETAAGEMLRLFAPRSSTEQLVDANVSLQNLRRDSGGRFFSSSGDRPARFSVEGEDVLERRREIGAQIVDRIRRTERHASGAGASELPEEIREAAGVWSSALELAKREGLALWCDDAATRRLATLAGVSSFSSLAVVSYLRTSNIFTAELAEIVEARLVSCWAVGVPFARHLYERALEFDGFMVAGTASVLGRSDGDDARSKVDLALMAMSKSVAIPEEIQRWSFIISEYLYRIAGEEAAAQQNIVVFCSALLNEEWMTPSVFRFIADGARAGSQKVWNEALTEAFRLFIGDLVQESGYELGARYVYSFATQLPESDRLSVLGVLLEPRR